MLSPSFVTAFLAMQAASNPSASTPGAMVHHRMRARLNGLMHAVDMLRAAAPTDPLAQSIHQAASVLSGEVAALGRTSSAPPENEIDLLQVRIDWIERAVLALDSTVPMLLFRRRVNVDLFPVTVVADYVTLLAQHMGADLDRRDRIDLLVTHLCSVAEDEGRRKMRPRPELEELLERVSRGHQARQDRRDDAVLFLERTRWKMAWLKKPEKIFEDGTYADAYGLKVALREDFLDPEILYAAAKLNVTVRNLLNKKKKADAPLEATEGAVKEALNTSHNSPELYESAHFERIRAEGRLLIDDAESHRAWNGIRRRRVVRLALVTVVALGLGATYLDRPPRPREVALSISQLGAVSPHLGQGNTVGQVGAQMLEATYDPFEWQRLSPEERQAEAAALTQELLRQTPLRAAAVRADGELIILVQAGKVVFVR